MGKIFVCITGPRHSAETVGVPAYAFIAGRSQLAKTAKAVTYATTTEKNHNAKSATGALSKLMALYVSMEEESPSARTAKVGAFASTIANVQIAKTVDTSKQDALMAESSRYARSVAVLRYANTVRGKLAARSVGVGAYALMVKTRLLVQNARLLLLLLLQ